MTSVMKRRRLTPFCLRIHNNEVSHKGLQKNDYRKGREDIWVAQAGESNAVPPDSLLIWVQSE